MKKLCSLFAILLAFALASPAFAQTAEVYSWTNVAAACTTTVTTSCGKTLTLSDVTSLTPAVISATILPTVSSYTLSPLPTAGVHNYLLVVNGFDAVGNAVTSTGATCGTAFTPPPCAVTIPAAFVLSPPAGFKATAQ